MPIIRKKLGGRTYRKFVLRKPTAVRKTFKKGGSRTMTMTRRRRFKSKKAYRNKKIKLFKRKKRIQQLADNSPWIISATDLPLNYNVAAGAVGPFNLVTTGNTDSTTVSQASPMHPVYVAPGDYRADIYGTLQLARGGASPVPGQDVNINQIKWRFQIRNNGNIAANVDYYQLRERNSRSDLTRDSFLEIYGAGLSAAGLLPGNSPLMLNPYKLDYITHRYVIIKKTRRLLPGEKWDFTYYTPIRGIHSTTKLLDRNQSRKTTYHGCLIYGDPVHHKTTDACSTAPCTVDVIVSNYIKVKRIEEPTFVNTMIASDNLVPVPALDVEFVAAFANAATAFSG